jgi:translation initiation factor 1 (eIF-1/SUI1)
LKGFQKLKSFEHEEKKLFAGLYLHPDCSCSKNIRSSKFFGFSEFQAKYLEEIEIQEDLEIKIFDLLF